MNQFLVKENFLFKSCIISFIGMLAILFFANILAALNVPENVFKALGLLCSLCFVITGLFFWVKHLRLAFRPEEKGLKEILLLFVLTIPYALYLEKKKTGHPKNSNR